MTTTHPATFPILNPYNLLRRWPNLPRGIPWELVQPHEAQAIRNHSQDLATLARRGGLDPVGLYHVMHDQPLVLHPGRPGHVSLEGAMGWLLALVKGNKSNKPRPTKKAQTQDALDPSGAQGDQVIMDRCLGGTGMLGDGTGLL